MQKGAIRTITGSKNRDSRRDLFKHLKILPFYSQYIFSLLIFVIENNGHKNRHIKTKQNKNVSLKLLFLARLSFYVRNVLNGI
jgi:hypothetical protein